jgi:hypothetical protein
MTIPLKTVPVKRATGGYIVVSARWPATGPPYVLSPSSDKPGILKLVTASRRVDGHQVLTLQGDVVLDPLDPDTPVLWALPADLEVIPRHTA